MLKQRLMTTMKEQPPRVCVHCDGFNYDIVMYSLEVGHRIFTIVENNNICKYVHTTMNYRLIIYIEILIYLQLYVKRIGKT